MQVTPELIEKYHSGQCTPDEQAAVEAWLAGEGGDEIPAYLAEPDRAAVQQRIWDNLSEVRRGESNAARKGMSHANGLTILWRYAGIAAGIVVVLGMAFWMRRGRAGSDVHMVRYQEVVTANGEKKRLYLPDSSLVYLNADSRLRFPEHFTDTSRRVYLSGEAFFEVAKDPTRPFTIETTHTETRVLGTVFDLKAYPGEPDALVVMEGKVRFGAKGGKQRAVLTANQMAEYDPANPTLVNRHVYAGAYAGWKNNRLAFRDSPLSEIAVVLERWYGVRVEVRKAALRKVIFTGTYDNASLETILDDMASSMKFTYRKQGNQLIIQ